MQVQLEVAAKQVKQLAAIFFLEDAKVTQGQMRRTVPTMCRLCFGLEVPVFWANFILYPPTGSYSISLYHIQSDSYKPFSVNVSPMGCRLPQFVSWPWRNIILWRAIKLVWLKKHNKQEVNRKASFPFFRGLSGCVSVTLNKVRAVQGPPRRLTLMKRSFADWPNMLDGGWVLMISLCLNLFVLLR